MRGNRTPSHHILNQAGSIPADAGQPCHRHKQQRHQRVYPRGCGATVMVSMPAHAVWGLSPRMRGNPDDRRLDRAALRSIPADAGQPPPYTPHFAHVRVYPRGCGATGAAQAPATVAQGLSPRMRGNHLAQRCVLAVQGSIPADAGQPWVPITNSLDMRVYPRGCGATSASRGVIWRRTGLSPRMRGNPAHGRRHLAARGSSPADAGQPVA